MGLQGIVDNFGGNSTSGAHQLGCSQLDAMACERLQNLSRISEGRHKPLFDEHP